MIQQFHFWLSEEKKKHTSLKKIPALPMFIGIKYTAKV